MENFREVQLKMLCELDQCCREHGIPYILSRHTAYTALISQSLPDKISVPTVAMYYTDAVRLAELMNVQNRNWESSLSNRNIPRMVIRYSDRNSFFLKIDEICHYKNHNLGVDIELIRRTPAKNVFNRMIVALEAAAVMCANFRCLSRGWSALLWIFKPLEKLVLRAVYKSRSDASGHIRICRFPKKSVEFSQSLLDNRKEVTMGGHSFFVPADIERYMTIEFNENWRNDDVFKDSEDTHLTVHAVNTFDPETEKLITRLYGNGPKINWIHWYALRGRMRFLRRKIEGYWDIMFCTSDRFKFYRQYIPQKQTICRLHQEQKLDELSEILEPYITALDKHYQKGLVLCFDEDILNITLSLLEAKGKVSYAQKLRSKVLPEHLKPMNLEVVDHE